MSLVPVCLVCVVSEPGDNLIFTKANIFGVTVNRLRQSGTIGTIFCYRYFLRVTVVKRLSDMVREQDIIVHTLSQYPELNNSIKMEVGIEDCLHIEFEYNKSKCV